MYKRAIITFILSIAFTFAKAQVFPYLNASTGNEGQYIVDSDTNIYMYHGNQLEKLDKNFNPIWVKTYTDLNFYSILLSKTGSIYFISKNATTSNYTNIIGKLNHDGSLNWCRQFLTSSSSNEEYFCQILLDRNNHLAISGSDNNMTGMTTKKSWFLKLDTLGDIVSSKIIEIPGVTFEKFVVTEDSSGTYRFIGDYWIFESGGIMVLKFNELLDSITRIGSPASVGQQSTITLRKFYKSKYDSEVYFSFHYVLNWAGPSYGNMIKYRNDSIIWKLNFNLPMGPYTIDNFDEDQFGNMFYTVSSSYMNYNSFTNSVRKINATCTSSQTVQYFSGFMFWPPNNTSDITGKVHALYGNKYFHDLYGSNFLSNPIHVTTLDSNLNATCTTVNTNSISALSYGNFMTPNMWDDQITNDASSYIDFFPTVTAIANFSINPNYCLSVDLKSPQPKEPSIEIFPNPANHTLIINTTESEIIEATIFDIAGKKVLSAGNQEKIDVSKLDSGIYFIKIKTDQGEFSLKFIKE